MEKQIYEIALQTIRNKVINGEKFSYEEIADEIIEKDGVMSVSFGVPVGRYILMLQDSGVLVFNKETEQFEAQPI